VPGRWYEDTTPKALEVFIELHRKMTPSQRLSHVFEMTEFMEGLQRSSVRSMYPDGRRARGLPEGSVAAARSRDDDQGLRLGSRSAFVSDFSAALKELLAALDRLEIPFLIEDSGGDIDVVAHIAPEVVAEFCAVLAPTFYADADEAGLAIRGGRAFNVIHLTSAYKFDIFPTGEDRLDARN
jgi:hypothetical protein